MTALLDHVVGLRAVLVEGPVGPTGQDGATDAERVDLIAALEQLKSAACAAQADLAVALDASVRAQHAADGGPSRQRGRGVAAQVALARQELPHRGQVLLGFAQDLATDLPSTRQALREGRLNEHRAMIVVRETGCLDSEQRAELDDAVCGDPDVLDGPRHRRAGRRGPSPRRRS